MEFKRICVIHLNQIGDLVFSLPLLKALKDNYPGSTIHSVIRPHLQELLSDSPYINELISRKSGFKNRLKLLKKLRQNRYDLLISLSNSGECLFLAAFSRAQVKAGFTCFPWDLSLDIKDKVEGHHSWRNNLKLLKKLNIQVNKNDYVGLLSLPPRDDLHGLPGFENFDFSARYMVISPGTSAKRTVKAWEEEKFADLIKRLNQKHQLYPLMVGGPENRETNDRIIELVKEKTDNHKIGMLNLAGKISLKDLCYVLKNAGLFVGVDSGIMHLAAAFNTPVVGIFGPTDPFYVGPQNARSIVVQKKEIECVPCYLKGCQDRKCMKRIEVKEVLDACNQLLSQPGKDS